MFSKSAHERMKERVNWFLKLTYCIMERVSNSKSENLNLIFVQVDQKT